MSSYFYLHKSFLMVIQELNRIVTTVFFDSELRRDFFLTDFNVSTLVSRLFIVFNSSLKNTAHVIREEKFTHFRSNLYSVLQNK